MASERSEPSDPEAEDIRILVQVAKKKSWSDPQKRKGFGKQLSPETYRSPEDLNEVLDTIKMETRNAVQKCE